MMATNREKILKALSTGKNTTVKQLANKTGIHANDVPKRIYELRQDGVSIYTNRKGNKSFYRLAA